MKAIIYDPHGLGTEYRTIDIPDAFQKEAFVSREYLEINAMKECLRAAGAAATLMSGSGPTVLAFFQKKGVYQRLIGQSQRSSEGKGGEF
jgi:4-diphosphocytidyl-2C-methyl-D-erythritol kinase